MIKVAALTSGRKIPSARFRVRQHVDTLRHLGVEVSEYCPLISQHARLPGILGEIRKRYLLPIALGQVILNGFARIPGIVGAFKSDLTWIERNFLPGFDDIVRLTRSPRILDVDDAIWLSDPFGSGSAARFAKQVDAIIAGNAYLADWYANYCSKVFIIPTAIDCERFKPRREDSVPSAKKTGTFVIGWTGTAANLKYLESIERPLARFLKAHPSTCLKVIANQRPHLPSIPANQVDFVKWSPSIEASALQDMDVGLMPLEDNEWTRGKCSFKMLQFMATGLPVVVSNVGMNDEILKFGECGFGVRTATEWLDALSLIYEDETLRVRMGKIGREIVVSSFSVPVIARQLASVFSDVAR